MERKLGEIFTYKGKTYQVVKAATCIECAFREKVCSLFKSYIGQYTPSTRSDKTSVIFKKIKDMEIKNNQLTINIPEGMGIDVEHSDLSKGIIKFKNNNINLEDIPCIIRDDIKINGFIDKNSKYYNYLKKLKSIATLMDIANYYNKGWKPNWNNKDKHKYYILLDNYRRYIVDYNYNHIYSIIYFKNKEDAQAVINNPNFRDILDTIYKD